MVGPQADDFGDRDQNHNDSHAPKGTFFFGGGVSFVPPHQVRLTLGASGASDADTCRPQA